MLKPNRSAFVSNVNAVLVKYSLSVYTSNNKEQCALTYFTDLADVVFRTVAEEVVFSNSNAFPLEATRIREARGHALVTQLVLDFAPRYFYGCLGWPSAR
jgi:hypothetical protein